ncbi:trigger factor [Sediminitomix flava]|uniref:Trigger factor n=1 Tax=Sediminitomix flava TaxID=379075 RepID=A0A315Z980_SEDFL|nr:trigger factor [Sediminitomix flava]PWJ40774.1 trigger factor [Sediminitomix flava]
MEFNFEKKESAHGLLSLKVSEADYKTEFDAQLKAQAKRANFKGFRPGKVPTSLVKKMYGKDLKQDIFNKTVSNAVDNYVKENDLHLLFAPMYVGEFLTPEQLDASKEVEVSFDLIIEPEFDYTLDKRTSVQGYQLEISDNDVENTINKLKESYPNAVDVEAAAKGDFIKANFKAVEGEEEPKESVVVLDEKVKEATVALFEGKKVGDVVAINVEDIFVDAKDIRVIFPMEEDAAADFKGAYEATITKITRNEEPALDQEFFDKVLGEGKADSEESFKAELKVVIADANSTAADSLLSNEVQKALMKKIDVEISEELLTKVYKQTSEKEVTDEEVAEKLADFTEAVKWRAIAGRISRDGEIKVGHEDIEAEAEKQIIAQFRQFGMGEIPADQLKGYVQNYLSYENGQKYNEIASQVNDQKLLDYVKDKVKVDEKVVDLGEFEEILKEATNK